MFKIICASLLAAPLFVFAHGDGLSLEKAKDGYLVDVGYSGELVEGDTIRFDLGLYKEGTKDPVGFSRAWVRIAKGEKAFFAGSISEAEFGEPGFSFVFAEDGAYDLFVRFENEDGSIVEAEFPIAVERGDEESGSSAVPLSIAGSLAGLAAGFALGRRLKAV